MAETDAKRPHSKLRLAKMHYDTAQELRWMYDEAKDWPQPPRNLKQKASLWLNRLAQEAGIKTAGLTREQIYLESIRALIRTNGDAASYPARMIQSVARAWEKSRREAWQREQKATTHEENATARTRATTVDVNKNCHSYAMYGLLAGDHLELEQTDEPRAGEVLLLWFNNNWEVGRFVGYDGDESGREIVLDQANDRYGFDLRSTIVYRVKAITRRFTPEQATADARKEGDARRLAELRTRLDKLTDITDESARFRIEREIYDLEHAVDGDEWPSVING